MCNILLNFVMPSPLQCNLKVIMNVAYPNGICSQFSQMGILKFMGKFEFPKFEEVSFNFLKMCLIGMIYDYTFYDPFNLFFQCCIKILNWTSLSLSNHILNEQMNMNHMILIPLQSFKSLNMFLQCKPTTLQLTLKPS